MAGTRIVAIVVNWQRKEETIRSVNSLKDLDTPCDIVVVDNGSNDSSVEYITQHCRHIALIALPSNIGFGSACNYAIRKALQNNDYDYVFLLNNDATVHPRALSELVHAAQAHPQAGIFGTKVYYTDRPNTIWYAGAHRRRVVLAALVNGRGQVDQGQFGGLREVDYIFGASMFIRREVFEKIGFFDERFFLYLEDLDFCLRAQEAGYGLLFVPQAHAWHKGFASTAENKFLRHYHMAKSRVHFLKKYTAPGLRVLVFVFWLVVYLRDLLLSLINSDLAVVKSRPTASVRIK